MIPNALWGNELFPPLEQWDPITCCGLHTCSRWPGMSSQLSARRIDEWVFYSFPPWRESEGMSAYGHQWCLVGYFVIVPSLWLNFSLHLNLLLNRCWPLQNKCNFVLFLASSKSRHLRAKLLVSPMQPIRACPDCGVFLQTFNYTPTQTLYFMSFQSLIPKKEPLQYYVTK